MAQMYESTDENINQYFEKQENAGDEILADQKKDEILKVIMQKDISYPSEVMREVLVSKDVVNMAISKLAKLGYIERFIPHPTSPQTVIAARIPELWTKGMIGNRIKSLSWWIITPGGFEYLKAKYKGQGVRISERLVNYLGFNVK